MAHHKQPHWEPAGQANPQWLVVCVYELLPHEEDGSDVEGVGDQLVDDLHTKVTGSVTAACAEGTHA